MVPRFTGPEWGSGSRRGDTNFRMASARSSFGLCGWRSLQYARFDVAVPWKRCLALLPVAGHPSSVSLGTSPHLAFGIPVMSHTHYYRQLRLFLEEICAEV
jgi:hypothetical protein